MQGTGHCTILHDKMTNYYCQTEFGNNFAVNDKI
jgi:hypothetical protein